MAVGYGYPFEYALVGSARAQVLYKRVWRGVAEMTRNTSIAYVVKFSKEL